MCIVHSNHCNVIVGVFVCSVYFILSNGPQFLLFYLLVMSFPAEPLAMHRGAQGLQGAAVGKHWCTLSLPIIVIKLNKYKRHHIGEHNLWLKLRYSSPSNANPSSPDVSLASACLITSTNWQTKKNLGSDHLPILISFSDGRHYQTYTPSYQLQPKEDKTVC